MAWYDSVGDWFSGSSSSSNSSGGVPDSWYSIDSSAPDSSAYDDLFNLSGTVKEDPSWWSGVLDTAGSVGGTVLKAANTPLGVGVIGGIAQGYEKYQDRKALDKQQQYSKDLLEEHKRSVATGPPEGLAKKVRVIR